MGRTLLALALPVNDHPPAPGLAADSGFLARLDRATPDKINCQYSDPVSSRRLRPRLAINTPLIYHVRVAPNGRGGWSGAIPLPCHSSDSWQYPRHIAQGRALEPGIPMLPARLYGRDALA
jgi:hypothetical protein